MNGSEQTKELAKNEITQINMMLEQLESYTQANDTENEQNQRRLIQDRISNLRGLVSVLTYLADEEALVLANHLQSISEEFEDVFEDVFEDDENPLVLDHFAEDPDETSTFLHKMKLNTISIGNAVQDQIGILKDMVTATERNRDDVQTLLPTVTNLNDHVICIIILMFLLFILFLIFWALFK